VLAGEGGNLRLAVGAERIVNFDVDLSSRVGRLLAHDNGVLHLSLLCLGKPLPAAGTMRGRAGCSQQ
jgi:hypothetical protein